MNSDTYLGVKDHQKFVTFSESPVERAMTADTFCVSSSFNSSNVGGASGDCSNVSVADSIRASHNVDAVSLQSQSRPHREVGFTSTYDGTGYPSPTQILHSPCSQPSLFRTSTEGRPIEYHRALATDRCGATNVQHPGMFATRRAGENMADLSFLPVLSSSAVPVPIPGILDATKRNDLGHSTSHVVFEPSEPNYADDLAPFDVASYHLDRTKEEIRYAQLVNEDMNRFMYSSGIPSHQLSTDTSTETEAVLNVPEIHYSTTPVCHSDTQPDDNGNDSNRREENECKPANLTGLPGHSTGKNHEQRLTLAGIETVSPVSSLESTVAMSNTSAALSRSSYMCRKCRAHGKLLPVKQHKRNCPFRNCTCAVCSLVNYGRHIVAKQIALYRDQKHQNVDLGESRTNYSRSAISKHCGKILVRSGLSISLTSVEQDDDGPHCRRCRNHGQHNPWKGHKKNCPYRCCMCHQCILISLRKSNEKNLREVVQESNEDQTEKRDRIWGKRRPVDVVVKPSPSKRDQSACKSSYSPTFNDYLHSLHSGASLDRFSLTQTPPNLFAHPACLERLPGPYPQSHLPLPHQARSSDSVPINGDPCSSVTPNASIGTILPKSFLVHPLSTPAGQIVTSGSFMTTTSFSNHALPILQSDQTKMPGYPISCPIGQDHVEQPNQPLYNYKQTRTLPNASANPFDCNTFSLNLSRNVMETLVDPLPSRYAIQRIDSTNSNLNQTSGSVSNKIEINGSAEYFNGLTSIKQWDRHNHDFPLTVCKPEFQSDGPQVASDLLGVNRDDLLEHNNNPASECSLNHSNYNTVIPTSDLMLNLSEPSYANPALWNRSLVNEHQHWTPQPIMPCITLKRLVQSARMRQNVTNSRESDPSERGYVITDPTASFTANELDGIQSLTIKSSAARPGISGSDTFDVATHTSRQSNVPTVANHFQSCSPSYCQLPSVDYNGNGFGCSDNCNYRQASQGSMLYNGIVTENYSFDNSDTAVEKNARNQHKAEAEDSPLDAGVVAKTSNHIDSSRQRTSNAEEIGFSVLRSVGCGIAGNVPGHFVLDRPSHFNGESTMMSGSNCHIYERTIDNAQWVRQLYGKLSGLNSSFTHTNAFNCHTDAEFSVLQAIKCSALHIGVTAAENAGHTKSGHAFDPASVSKTAPSCSSEAPTEKTSYDIDDQ